MLSTSTSSELIFPEAAARWEALRANWRVTDGPVHLCRPATADKRGAILRQS